MSNAQHTPGPWKSSHDGMSIFNPDGPLMFVIAEMNTKPCKTAPFIAQQAANARLMAAAPELLAALEQMMDAFYHDPLEANTSAAIEAAEDAIAKAKCGAV